MSERSSAPRVAEFSEMYGPMVENPSRVFSPVISAACVGGAFGGMGRFTLGGSAPGTSRMSLGKGMTLAAGSKVASAKETMRKVHASATCSRGRPCAVRESRSGSNPRRSPSSATACALEMGAMETTDAQSAEVRSSQSTSGCSLRASAHTSLEASAVPSSPWMPVVRTTA